MPSVQWDGTHAAGPPLHSLHSRQVVVVILAVPIALRIRRRRFEQREEHRVDATDGTAHLGRLSLADFVVQRQVEDKEKEEWNQVPEYCQHDHKDEVVLVGNFARNQDRQLRMSFDFVFQARQTVGVARTNVGSVHSNVFFP